jgi:thiamine biosynthesis lipoprotein
MNTIVTVRIADSAEPGHEELVRRAFGYFAAVEAACSRFRPGSELRRAATCAGSPVPIGPILRATLEIALDVAGRTEGAFDPSAGPALAASGFDREYRTGARAAVVTDRTWGGLADIHLDAAASTVTFDRPVLPDLGAVAKGVAVDLAAAVLREQPAGFVIDAGGEVYAGGRPGRRRWPVGIAAPPAHGGIATVVRLEDLAVATSAADPGTGRLVDSRGEPVADRPAGVSVVAPSAAVADALSTAVLVLGAAEGLLLIERTAAAEVLAVSRSGQRSASSGWRRVMSARRLGWRRDGHLEGVEVRAGGLYGPCDGAGVKGLR